MLFSSLAKTMVYCFYHYLGTAGKQQGLKLLFSLMGAFIILCLPAEALATESAWQWHGDRGYQVNVQLIYPDTVTSGMAMIEGKGSPKQLEDLTVRIYDPNGKELASYDNVVAGQPGASNFLQLHFDIGQQQLRGWLDIGGAVENEYFLKGQPGISLDLFYVNAQGNEIKVDHNDGDMLSDNA